MRRRRRPDRRPRPENKDKSAGPDPFADALRADIARMLRGPEVPTREGIGELKGMLESVKSLDQLVQFGQACERKYFYFIHFRVDQHLDNRIAVGSVARRFKQPKLLLHDDDHQLLEEFLQAFRDKAEELGGNVLNPKSKR